MYVRRIHIENLGAISNLTIEPSFLSDGRPVPVVLVGKNGAGKSLTLAIVLDALTEARRQSFQQIPEVSQTSYLRLSRKAYVRAGADYSLAEASINSAAGGIDYYEVVSRVDHADLSARHPTPGGQ